MDPTDPTKPRVMGTDTFWPIHYHAIPQDRRGDITYTRVVCEIHPHKAKQHCTCITIGGNCICYPGDIGTKGGLLTDRDARVLNDAGQVIPGLYCIGNNSASVMGPAYPGAGSTLGPAMTFAYRAISDIKGQPIPLERTDLLESTL